MYKDLEDLDVYSDGIDLLSAHDDDLGDTDDDYSADGSMSQLPFAPSSINDTRPFSRTTENTDRMYVIYTQMQRRRRIAISFCLAQTLLAVTHIAILPWRDDETDVSLSLVLFTSLQHPQVPLAQIAYLLRHLGPDSLSLRDISVAWNVRDVA